MKKIIVSLAIGLSLFTLTGCKDELSNVDVNNEISASIGDSSTQESNKEKKNATISHDVTFNDQKIVFDNVYAIDQHRFSDWYFTQASTIDLNLDVKELPENVSIKVLSVYSDLSILSKIAKTNGLRQDSIFVEYGQLSTDGISVDKNNGFSIPFQVEGINQNELSISAYNGYGSGESHRVTESQMRDRSYGAKLNTVWTLLLSNDNTNETFIKTINDTVLIPVKGTNGDDDDD